MPTARFWLGVVVFHGRRPRPVLATPLHRRSSGASYRRASDPLVTVCLFVVFSFAAPFSLSFRSGSLLSLSFHHPCLAWCRWYVYSHRCLGSTRNSRVEPHTVRSFSKRLSDAASRPLQQLLSRCGGMVAREQSACDRPETAFFQGRPKGVPWMVEGDTSLPACRFRLPRYLSPQ